MAIDTNIPTTTPAMDQQPTNLFQENKSLQQKNQILYQQVELLTKLHQARQEGLLHQSQNVETEDSTMKEDQPLSAAAAAAAAAELKHESEKQLEDGLKQEEVKQDDSDVTLGRDVGGGDEQEDGGQDKDADQAKDDDKMDEDEEEEHSSYANSEASDYEGPESWDGDSLGGDPEASDPEKGSDDEDEDETMEDDDKNNKNNNNNNPEQKWGEGKGPGQYHSRECRNYYISKYKRDRLQSATALDEKLAAKAPSSSSYQSCGLGECKLDTWLYFDSGLEPTRTDFNAYKSLYGFHPAIVDFLEYKPTLRLLDRHADKVASWYSPKQEFHDRFREFVEAFEKADYPSDYLEGDLSSEVARAHMAFCEALDSC